MRRILLIALALALVSYFVWDRLEAHWLRQAIAAIAARGEPTMLDAGSPEPSTAQQKDAANLYAQAAEAALESDDNNRAGRLDVDKPGGAELSLDDVRVNYPDEAPALQLLARATPLDFGGFEKEQREGDSFAQSNLERGLSTLANIACLRADVASLAGGGDAAARALVPCIRVKRTVKIPQYRAAVADRILGSVRILFRHTRPSDAALADLQHALESWPDADYTSADFMRDRARFISMSAVPIYPGLSYAIARAVLHPLALRSARDALERFESGAGVLRESWADRWRVVLEMQRISIERFREHPPTWLEKIADPYLPIAPVSPYLLTTAARELAARRLIATAVTVERYRRAHADALPVTLDVGEDPFSGRPLIYKKEQDGYSIYSVDVNRKDDGGILYGFGAAGLSHYGQQTPRDYGIRVPLNPR